MSPALGVRSSCNRARWPAALVVAVVAHGGLAWAAWPRGAAPAESAAATVMMIDFAPTASAPSARVQDLAPGPQASEETPAPVEAPASLAAEESRMGETKPDPPPVAPEPAAPAAPPEAQATPSPVAPPVAAPKVALAPVRKKPSRAASATRASASVPTAVARSSTAAAPDSSLSQSRAETLLTWKGALLAHISRFKRFPREATGVGVATVTFTIGEGGQVIAARLVASSGDAALDSEAVDLLRRASPVPPPPERRTLTLNLPIRFNRQ